MEQETVLAGTLVRVMVLSPGGSLDASWRLGQQRVMMGGVRSVRARDALWIATISPPPASAPVNRSPHPSCPAWGQQGGLARLGPTLGHWHV